MVMDAQLDRSEKKTPRREGPKRSESSRQAILEAAREELIEHGWKHFSPDRLAKRAKASKQTIYRWWPSIATIAVEAGLEPLASPASPRASDLQASIEALLRPISEMARVGNGAHLLRSALLAAADDASAGETFRHWFNSTYRKPLKTVLAEAAVKGKIRRDWDIDSVCEMLYGPLWHRMVLMRGPLPELIVTRVTNSVLLSLRP